MMPLRSLAAAVVLAAGTAFLPDVATPAPVPNSPAPRSIARWTDGSIISLGIVPASGRIEIVIGVAGNVDVKDSYMDSPHRIVVDLDNATLKLPAGASYDRQMRGPITNVRYAQRTARSVRVVLDLTQRRKYSITRADGELRIVVEGPADEFSSWQVGAAQPAMAKAPADAVAVSPPAAAMTVAADTVQIPATPAPVASAPLTTMTAVAPVPQQSQQRRITINFDNTPIADVIRTFAAFSGRTIIPGKAVTGTTSASITDQPWDVALRGILISMGYDAYETVDGLIMIDTIEAIAQQKSVVALQTRVVRLNYVKAHTVADIVKMRLSRDCGRTTTTSTQPNPQATTGAAGQPPTTTSTVESLTCPQRGAVTADSLSQSIHITDVPSMLDELADYARALDIRSPQVNIRAKIIFVDRTSLEGLGLRYDLGNQSQFFNDIVPRLDSLGKPRTDAGQISLGGNVLSAIANAGQRVPAAAVQLVYSTAVGGFDFTTFIEALQQTSLIDVQGEPSVTVMNNRTANLTSGTDFPVRVVDVGAGANAQGNQPRANVQFRQTGVILNVTPQITNNRQVQMKVHVENSSVQLVSSDVGAVFPTQKVDNEVLVADGETAVMGGLTLTTVRVTKTGIPFLVDLPIIGRLFGVTTRSESKQDLLILITPHIVDEGQTSRPPGPPGDDAGRR